MKRLISMICIVAMFTGILSGCSFSNPFVREEKQDNTLKIGISVYDQYDTFISSVVDSFYEWAKKKEQETDITITIDFQNAGGNQSVQNDQMSQFVSGGCDVALINLVDRTDATVVIERAKNAGIPVVFFNRELVQEDLERWDQLYYVGAVALESGEMEGQILIDACKENFDEYDKNDDGELQYVILEGEAGHQDALVRTEYVIKTVTAGGIVLEKLGNEIANWNRAQGESKMQAWMNEFGEKMEVVFANNDDMALGAIDALGAWERNRWPVVLGIDGTAVALQAVKNGELMGTVINNGKGQARSMLELAFHLKFATPLPSDIILENGRYVRLPHKIVTIDNVDEIIKNR